MHRLTSLVVLASLAAGTGCAQRRDNLAWVGTAAVSLAIGGAFAIGRDDGPRDSGCTDGPGCVTYDIDGAGLAAAGFITLGVLAGVIGGLGLLRNASDGPSSRAPRVVGQAH